MSQAACDLLRAMLSSCAKWQQLTGSTGPTAAASAAEKIHLFGRLGDPELPAAYIRTVSDSDTLLADGFFYGTGELNLEVELPERSAASIAAEYAQVQADWDTLKGQLLALAQEAPNLRITSWSGEPLALAQEKRNTKFWVMSARIGWS